MCPVNARVVVRNLTREPSLLILILILLSIFLGIRYKGGMEALMLLLLAIVTAYSGKARKTTNDQDLSDRRIKRVQWQTYGVIGAATLVSNLDFPYSEIVAIGIAAIGLLYFTYKIGQIEA